MIMENGTNGVHARHIPESMRALRIVKEKPLTLDSPPIHSLDLTTVPVPTVTPGTVLVRICASSINPSDAANARGYFPYTTFPRVPGRDFAGIVVDGPSHLHGQHVFGTSGHDMSFTRDGACAEYCLIPEGGIVVIPSGLTFVQAATIGVPFITAWLMLERAHIKPTDSVLVIGANGAVGSAACQLARAKGCQVITTARDDTADINTTTDPQLEGAKSMTSGKGPSVILDTVGNPDLMKSALDVLPIRGRLSYISAPKEYHATFSFDMRSLYRMEKVIIGCNSLNYTIEESANILRELAPDFGSGGRYNNFDMSKVVEVQFDEQALDAYATVGGQKKAELSSGSKGTKFVITM